MVLTASGSGSGSGSGYGYGYGDGSGDGDGYGYGYGYGYGDGYGYGYGDGYGDGDGYGYGYGYGGEEVTKLYFSALLGPYAQPDIRVAFWRSTSAGTPANGGSGTQAKVGLVEQIPGPLAICTVNGLHATHHPSEWRGDRWWVVGLHEPVQMQPNKLASLKRTFLADLGPCPFT